MTTTLVDDGQYSSEPLELAATTTDGIAREAALCLLRDSDHVPTSVVSYRSEGHLLVNTSEQLELGLVQKIKDTGLICSILISGPQFSDAALRDGPGNVDQLEGKVTAFSGYLGDFRVLLQQTDGSIDAAELAGLRDRGFDLVLDLSEHALLEREVLPLGYYAPDTEEDIERVLGELPGMVGEFDKPKFFKLDPNICAHTSRGVIGCTRCLDVCPTRAINTATESVEVDPYLCQGIGVCTTVCPTGAISYGFPQVSDMLDDLRRVLHRYHDERGARPALVFHDGERGKVWMQQALVGLAENLIPVEVENTASVGMDIWLACLAYGAHHIFLLATDESAPGVVESVKREIDVTQIILGAMGYPRDRVTLLRPDNADQIAALIPAKIGKQLLTPAGFAGFNEKRTTLRLALDHLCEHAPKIRKSVSLPAGSPFGRVKVDKQACTLCMSCVAVCPASALTTDSGLPKLMFLERNCVQCGLCEKACPEDAITLEARYNFDADLNDQTRVMYEEEPFNCVKCGTPFSTQSMISKMRERLKDHWMYKDKAQLRRLEMCDNCRVEDLYVKGGGMDPYDNRSKPTGSKV